MVEFLKHCPKCNILIRAHLKKCPWCDTEIKNGVPVVK